MRSLNKRKALSKKKLVMPLANTTPAVLLIAGSPSDTSRSA